MKYRCRECTLLRVDAEGAVCEECRPYTPKPVQPEPMQNGITNMTYSSGTSYTYTTKAVDASVSASTIPFTLTIT